MVEVGADEGQIVVVATVAVVDRERALRDRVAADILTGRTRQSADDSIAEGERAACDLIGQCRIGVTVDLGLGSAVIVIGRAVIVRLAPTKVRL